eukprot:6174980-Pleurochrysis_carterae.AAC.1
MIAVAHAHMGAVAHASSSAVAHAVGLLRTWPSQSVPVSSCALCGTLLLPCIVRSYRFFLSTSKALVSQQRDPHSQSSAERS